MGITIESIIPLLLCSIILNVITVITMDIRKLSMEPEKSNNLFRSIKLKKNPRHGIRKRNKRRKNVAIYAQNQGSHLYVDSGCSMHMTGDRNKFLSLREDKIYNVTFGNDALGKIIGKGTINLENGRGKGKNVIFVNGIKKNLLCVIQVSNQEVVKQKHQTQEKKWI